EQAGESPPSTGSPATVVDPSPAPPAPGWLAVLCAPASGGGLLLAFPPFGLWWAAPVGVAPLAVAGHPPRPRTGFGLGLLSGLALFVPLLSWTHIVGGVAPWLILSVTESVFVGLLGAAASWTSPVADRYRWAWPLTTGVLWVGQEGLRDRLPFG